MLYRRLARRALVAAALSLAGACVGDATHAVDEAALERVRAYDSMARVSTVPYASEISESRISVWFGGGGVDDYLRIHPDRVGSGAVLDQGAMIVREVLAADGSVERLTVMCKGPAGYNPDLGDWWYAVTDPDGEPIELEGELQVGRLTGCYACHQDRPDDDYLFGVPEAALPSHP